MHMFISIYISFVITLLMSFVHFYFRMFTFYMVTYESIYM